MHDDGTVYEGPLMRFTRSQEDESDEQENEEEAALETNSAGLSQGIDAIKLHDTVASTGERSGKEMEGTEMGELATEDRTADGISTGPGAASGGDSRVGRDVLLQVRRSSGAQSAALDYWPWKTFEVANCPLRYLKRMEAMCSKRSRSVHQWRA